MSSATDSVPISHRLLPNAGRRARSAPCALALGERSLGARPLFHPAHPDGGEYVCDAAHDAAGRDGSGAAENDELVDACDDGLHFLQSAGGIKSVLRGNQFDFDAAAVSDEPHQAGPRNARDNGKARAQERKVKWLLAPGLWPLAWSA